MNVIPFAPEHFTQMQVQERQKWELSHIVRPYAEFLGKIGPAASAEHDGRIIACAGIAVQDFGMGTLWALVSQDAGRHMVRLDKCVRRLLEIPQLRRIEASTLADFEPGCRWLELLHFEREGVKRKYGPNGEDHMGYARTWP